MVDIGSTLHVSIFVRDEKLFHLSRSKLDSERVEGKGPYIFVLSGAQKTSNSYKLRRSGNY